MWLNVRLDAVRHACTACGKTWAGHGAVVYTDHIAADWTCGKMLGQGGLDMRLDLWTGVQTDMRVDVRTRRAAAVLSRRTTLLLGNMAATTVQPRM